MGFSRAKRRWFKKNVNAYSVYLKWYGWQYLLIQYQDNYLIPSKQELPQEVQIIQQYLWGMEPYELFCEVRRLKLDNVNKHAEFEVVYNTHKYIKYTLEKYLNKKLGEN